MKQVHKDNINTAQYWNKIYQGKENREQYRKNEKGLSKNQTTNRFLCALSEVRNGDNVLDIGCGIGTFTKLVKETYPDCAVYGIDISDKVIEENKLEENGVYYYVGEIGKLPPSDLHDIVFAGEVLEHLTDPNLLFKDAHKALVKGGKFVLTTPRNDIMPGGEHIWEFDERDIHKLYLANGFDNVTFTKLPDNEYLFVIFAVGVKA